MTSSSVTSPLVPPNSSTTTARCVFRFCISLSKREIFIPSGTKKGGLTWRSIVSTTAALGPLTSSWTTSRTSRTPITLSTESR
jgi:hypothetical protein